MKARKSILAGLCVALSLLAFMALAGQPIAPVRHVDLSRYMGRWYVIAFIPTSYGKDAYNMVETYRLQKNGQVCTSLWFRDGGFDGEIKRKNSLSDVAEGSGNAVWKVHVFWFIHAQYIAAWLAPDYSQVIVARDKRDYAWFMARRPQVSAADYRAMVGRVKAMGYDVSKLQRVPQMWTSSELASTTFAQSCD